MKSNVKDKFSSVPAELRRIWHKIAVALFPNVCPACNEVTGSDIDGELCETCRGLFFEQFVTKCPRCGGAPADCGCAPDVAGVDSDRSPFTKMMPLTFSGFYTGYDDKPVVSALVYNLKRDHACGASTFFARMITQSISRNLVLWEIPTSDIIVTYIPRSKSAVDEHGFDHMEMVAKQVAEMLGCRYARLLSRKGGKSQKKLGQSDRQTNANETIDINPQAQDKITSAKILLLDDIITTGSTMRAAVSKLSFAGAETIIPCSAMISKTKKKETP